MRSGRAVRAALVVAGLGLGAGTGAVLGLWAGLGWWLHRRSATSGGSLLPAIASGAVGALLGLLLGTALAGGAVAMAGLVRRRSTPVVGADPAGGADQSRSS